MLFTIGRSNDCPFKCSFYRMMRKYKIVDSPVKRLSNGTSDEYSNSTDDTEFSSRSSTSSELMNQWEEETMIGLRQYCDEQGIQMSDQRLFRFANFHNFDLAKAKEAVDENRENAFLDLEMRSELRGQFVNKMLFPLPGLTTKKHHSQVIYSRPSRGNQGNPEEDTMTKILESLCYVMNDYSQTEQQCRDGVALVSNMEGLTMKHFDPQDWQQFLLALQGLLVPTKVTTILIVNAPSWFQQNVWKKMKSSMPYKFRRNVHIISSPDKLGDYLMEDYRAYLPTELDHGYRLASEVIEDYIDLKSFEDRQKRTAAALMV